VFFIITIILTLYCDGPISHFQYLHFFRPQRFILFSLEHNATVAITQTRHSSLFSGAQFIWRGIKKKMTVLHLKAGKVTMKSDSQSGRRAFPAGRR